MAKPHLARNVCTRLSQLVFVCLVLELFLTGAASAFKFTRPITIIVPFGAGGAGDIFSRLVADSIRERLDTAIVVQNRTGAVGLIGTAAGAQAPPDGYTLTFVSNNLVTSKYLLKNVEFDAVKSFAPVAILIRQPSIIVVNPAIPARNARQLLELAKAKPGSITFGSSGTGGQMMLGLLNSYMPESSIIYVPFRGETEAFTGVTGGHLSAMAATVPLAASAIKDGRVIALGVSTATRSTLVPDVPAVAETLPGYQYDSWYGFVAPAGTPREAIDEIYDAMSMALKTPQFRQKIADLGFEAAEMGPEAFRDFIQQEDVRLGKIIADAGIKPQ